jgi:hypothetical protein
LNGAAVFYEQYAPTEPGTPAPSSPRKLKKRGFYTNNKKGSVTTPKKHFYNRKSTEIILFSKWFAVTLHCNAQTVCYSSEAQTCFTLLRCSRTKIQYACVTTLHRHRFDNFKQNRYNYGCNQEPD